MNFFKGIGVVAALAMGTGACSGETVDSQRSSEQSHKGAVGSVGMAITLPDDSAISAVSYNITGPNGYSRTGSVPVADSTILTFRVGGVPVGNGYTIALSATTSFGTECMGSASFNILTNATTRVSVPLTCGATDTEGDLIVDGEFQSCPIVTQISAIPAEARVGSSVSLTAAISHGDTPVAWAGTGGTFSAPGAYATQFTCSTIGSHTLTARIDAAEPACNNTSSVEIVCSPGAGCGNALPDQGEQCDDGNSSNTDACTNGCNTATCGDGFVRAGVEECDDGNGVNTDGCANNCQANICGNGRVDAGEACDGTPGCNPANCQLLGCGDGIVTAPETCDDQNDVATDGCTNNCRVAACGDGIVQTGVEACDDGNLVAGDGCENDCTLTPSAGGDIPNQLAACRSCRQANCTAFQGAFDLVAACFQNPDPLFVQQCIDVKNCAYTNNCGYNATGAAQCFCGTVDLNTCQNAGAANGPCQAQWYAAARTTSLATLIGSFSDVSLPSGVAYYFQECDRDFCTACNP